MNTNEQITKPLMLEIEDIKTEILEIINNAIQTNKVNCYFLEPFIADLHAQMKRGAEQELNMARAHMQQLVKQSVTTQNDCDEKKNELETKGEDL